MNPETDTPRTEAMPSNQSMLTAQSDPVKLYQQLCKVTVDFGKALDACVEYQDQLAASKAEVAKLNHQLLKTESDLLQSQDINSFLDTEFRIACKRAEKAEAEIGKLCRELAEARALIIKLKQDQSK
jgi:hypothetical protein